MQVKVAKKEKDIKNKKTKRIISDLVAWLIAVPSLLLFFFFIWLPILQNISLSFFRTSGFNKTEFVFLSNYIDVFRNPLFLQALKNTLLYVGFSLLIGFVIPIILALLISEVVHSKSLFKISFYVPNIVPAIAVILMWKIMMDPNQYGFFNVILSNLGLNTSRWLSNDALTIPLIILTLTWKSAGSTMLIYLATLNTIDSSLYEAARSSGASLFKRLRYITLPALFQNVKLLLILQIISIFQIFYEPLVFMGNTNDSVNTLGLLIYKFIYTDIQNVGYAASLGVITLFILLGLTALYLVLDKSTSTNSKNPTFKKYISYETMLYNEQLRDKKRAFRIEKSKAYRILIKIGESIKWFFTKIGLFFKFIFSKINSFFEYITRKTTKKYALKIFKKKKDGIVTFSDYKSSRYRILYYAIYLLLILWMIVVLVPFLWLFFTSFKPTQDIFSTNFFPKTMDFGKYIDVIKKTNILKNVLNSTIIAVGAAVCSVVFNGLLAYVVSILKPKGSKVIFYLILGSMLVPVTVSLVPLFQNITWIYDIVGKILGGNAANVQRTYLSYIPFWLIAGASPFNFLLFKTHFDNLPKDLFDMAKIEGATKLQIFFKIVIPLSVPIMMVVGIFSITASWNDFLLPYIVIQNDSLWTVMVKVFSINANMAPYMIKLDEFLCLLMFTMLPPIIIFFIFQKNITSNVATTGIK
ncbi:MAG: ABC transporter permease subunit [Acholeplasmatales bacterium]|jgi:multiple sugar transport system permease protein|nr:ABC transporter permease subunit [Acholeplasmatales bacterium]